MDISLVIIGDMKHRKQVLALMDEIRVNTRRENGEPPLLLPTKALRSVFIDARHFDVLPWPGTIDEVGSENDFLVAGHAAGGDGAGGFLQNDFLVVPEEGGGGREGGRVREQR